MVQVIVDQRGDRVLRFSDDFLHKHALDERFDDLCQINENTTMQFDVDVLRFDAKIQVVYSHLRRNIEIRDSLLLAHHKLKVKVDLVDLDLSAAMRVDQTFLVFEVSRHMNAQIIGLNLHNVRVAAQIELESVERRLFKLELYVRQVTTVEVNLVNFDISDLGEKHRKKNTLALVERALSDSDRYARIRYRKAKNASNLKHI